MSDNSHCKYHGMLSRTIFDSRKGKNIYNEHNHYRTASFEVPGGYYALIEVTTPDDYKDKVSFVAKRVPKSLEDNCYSSDMVKFAKLYRRWCHSQSLGNHVATGINAGSSQTPYNNSVVYWGYNHNTKRIVEFEYITRPGVYYMVAYKCGNEVLEDCCNPTFLEMTLVPATEAGNLLLPCSQ